MPLIFMTLLTLFCLPLHAGGFTWQGSQGSFKAEITLQDEQIQTGDSLDLTAQFTLPKGYYLDVAALKRRLQSDNTFGPLPLSLVEESVEKSEDGQEITLNYQFEANLEGKYFVTLGAVTIQSETADPITLITPAFPVVISKSTATDQKINETLFDPLPLIKRLPPALSTENKERFVTGEKALEKEAERNEKIRRFHTFPLFPLLIFFACLAALFLLRAYFKSRYEKTRGIRERAALKKHAYSALNRLQTQENVDYDLAYSELTTLIRGLIEEVWQLKAPALTTAEFLKEASHHPTIQSSTQALLKEFFEAADQVKFAELRPPKKEWQEALKMAKKVLDTLFQQTVSDAR